MARSKRPRRSKRSRRSKSPSAHRRSKSVGRKRRSGGRFRGGERRFRGENLAQVKAAIPIIEDRSPPSDELIGSLTIDELVEAITIASTQQEWFLHLLDRMREESTAKYKIQLEEGERTPTIATATPGGDLAMLYQRLERTEKELAFAQQDQQNPAQQGRRITALNTKIAEIKKTIANMEDAA